MKENTAAVATTLERKLSHFRTINLNRAVNVLCDRHFKALMRFSIRAYVYDGLHMGARTGLRTGICASMYGLTNGRTYACRR